MPAPATTVKAPPAKAPAASPNAKSGPIKSPAAPAAKAPSPKAAAPAGKPAEATAPDTGAETKTKKPKEERTIEEELQMAIEGTLTPRKALGTADQENLLTRASNGRPVGRPKGVTTGLTIQMAWQYLFQQNEKAPAKPAQLGSDGVAIPGSGKMTDPQITAFMHREFPGRENNTFNSPAMARRLQNNGQATRGAKPKLQSKAYGPDAKEAPSKAIGEGLKKANEARAAKKVADTGTDDAEDAEEVEDDEEVESDA